MKILVTVGTTSFDQLIKEIDLNCPKNWEVQFQIASGSYKPVNFPSFTFSDNIEEVYQMSELIICHAGAGSVYSLLELKKRIIVVPNMYRVDPHQQELAKYVENNSFALVCWNIDDILMYIQKSTKFEPNVYIKDRSIAAELINGIINELNI